MGSLCSAPSERLRDVQRGKEKEKNVRTENILSFFITSKTGDKKKEGYLLDDRSCARPLSQMPLDNPLDRCQDVREPAGAAVVQGFERDDLGLFCHAVGGSRGQGSYKRAVPVLIGRVCPAWQEVGPVERAASEIVMLSVDATKKKKIGEKGSDQNKRIPFGTVTWSSSLTCQ